MAKIEMDLSEYEKMMEVKKLLENSLEKERELEKEIRSMNDARIQTLKDAEMKVIKISRKEVVEYPIQKIESRYVISEFLKRLGTREVPPHICNTYIEDLGDIFFRKDKVISYPSEETITMHGLDEIRKEIRDSVEKDIREELEECGRMSKKFDKINYEKSQIEIKLKYEKEISSVLTKDNAALIEYQKNLMESAIKDRKRLEEIEKQINNCNFWNREKVFEKLKNILK